MAGKKPDYKVLISREGKDKKNFYTEIGVAWKVSSNGISVHLNAAPVDGKMVLFPIEAKAE